jgi:hypothetical protein
MSGAHDFARRTKEIVLVYHLEIGNHGCGAIGCGWPGIAHVRSISEQH